MAFIFARHPQAVGNLMTQDERAAHPTPNHLFPLTPLGERQAHCLGEYLAARFRFALVLDTNFLRSQQGLDIVMPYFGNKPPVRKREPLFDEHWEGIFHALSKQDIATHYPKQIALRKKHGPSLYRAPGGESGPDVEVRVELILLKYRQQMLVSDILAVGHGRQLLYLLKVLYGWSIEELEAHKKDKERSPKNAEVFVFSNEALIEKLPPERIVPWEGKVPDMDAEFA